MKVLAHVHRFVPDHRSGAEVALLEVLKFLVQCGHEVTAAVRDAPSDYVYQGVRVRALGGTRLPELKALYSGCDIAITHLDLTRGACREATLAGKPMVHLVHNEKTLRQQNVKPDRAAIVAYNSEWLRRQVEYVQGDHRFSDRSLIVRPLVRTDAYHVLTTDDCLTLVNLNENKGAELFYELAKRFPRRKFLGVVGSYKDQIIYPMPNVEIIPNGDIIPVYERTGILLMPSFYESWGRTALEAASSGIPTIAHPTPGLLEALGAGGLFAGRNVPEAWAEWILRLDDPAFRQMMSDAAWERAHLQEVRAVQDLKRLEEEMQKCAR